MEARRLTRTSMRALPALLALGIALVVGTLDAQAKPQAQGAGGERTPSGAAAEFEKLGKAAYGKQDWDNAIAAFEGAYEADPLPRFLFNIGRCHEKKGDLARASQYFERYLEAAPGATDRPKVEALARMLRIRLEKSSSKLVVVADQEDALVQVRVGDEPIRGTSPFSYWVPFGKYRIVVEKVGLPTWEAEVLVTPGKLAKVEVRMEPVLAATAPPPVVPEAGGAVEPAGADGPTAAPVPSAPEPSQTQAPPASSDPRGAEEAPAEALAWFAPSTLAVGAALLAGGGVLGWLSGRSVEDRDALVDKSWGEDVAYSEYRSQDDTAQGRALFANILLGAGAVAAVSGAVLLLTGSDDTDEAGGRLTLAPAGPGAAVLWSGALP